MNPHQQYIEQLYDNARRFWAAWQQHENRLSALAPQDFTAQANLLLEQFCAGVIIEYETAAERLVFSAQGRREFFPQTEILAQTAPHCRYAVQPFRAALADSTDLSLHLDGIELSAADISVSCALHNEHPALTFAFNKPIAEADYEAAQNLALLLTDHVLGEWRAAVQIGAADFAQTAAADAVPLAKLPEKLAQIWQTLGHSGEYPQGECQYAAYEAPADPNNEREGVIFIRNQSAAALLGCGGLDWFVAVSCGFQGKDQLQRAYALQDELEACARANHQGIGTLTLTRLGAEGGIRTVYAATRAPLILLSQAQDLCRRYADLSPEAVCEFDPSWEHYRIL